MLCQSSNEDIGLFPFSTGPPAPKASWCLELLRGPASGDVWALTLALTTSDQRKRRRMPAPRCMRSLIGSGNTRCRCRPRGPPRSAIAVGTINGETMGRRQAVQRRLEHDRALLEEVQLHPTRLALPRRTSSISISSSAIWSHPWKGARVSGYTSLPITMRDGIQQADDLADALRFETVKDYEDWIGRAAPFSPPT